MERLKNALGFGGILPKKAIDYIVGYAETELIEPGSDFLPQGTICSKIGFVNKGVIRVYATGKNGDEVTKYFVRENQFVVDLESYYNATPAESVFQAVLATEIFTIQRNTWNGLTEEIPKLYVLMKSLTEATLLNKLKDNDFLNFGSAKEKYLEFIKRYPDLALKIPQRYIASYLKITPQSLSRIRLEITKKQ